jgi:hypothetical protein
MKKINFKFSATKEMKNVIVPDNFDELSYPDQFTFVKDFAEGTFSEFCEIRDIVFSKPYEEEG